MKFAVTTSSLAALCRIRNSRIACSFSCAEAWASREFILRKETSTSWHLPIFLAPILGLTSASPSNSSSKDRPLGFSFFFFFFLPSSFLPPLSLLAFFFGDLSGASSSLLEPSPLPSPPSPSSFFAPLSFFAFFFGAARSSSSSEPSSYSSSTSDSAPGAKSSSSPSLSSSSSSSSASCCWRCRLTRCRYGSSSASSSSSSSAARACELTFLIVMLVAFRKRKSSL
mmetsp:Transcript_18965/g.47629  ORF Transcript_18965/g.47629 Transcript_18965/m.47629 type:complete len:226 (+) Transcript_18965:699-1376(+)